MLCSLRNCTKLTWLVRFFMYFRCISVTCNRKRLNSLFFFVFSFFGSFVVLYISLFVFFFFQFEGQEFERGLPWNVHFLFLIGVTILKSVASLLQVDDDLPFESIYDALINRVPPPPNQATQPVRNMEFELTWIMYPPSFGCHPRHFA